MGGLFTRRKQFNDEIPLTHLAYGRAGAWPSSMSLPVTRRSMTDNFWYPFYVGDYDRKTAHLSLLEHGAYRRLMDHYYATKSPLPNDDTKLFRICGARSPAERKAVLLVATEFFIKTESLYLHKRCSSEIDKQLKYRERQSAAGKRRHKLAPATAQLHAPVTTTTVKEETPLKVPLPDFIPADDFQAYEDMRKKIRKPMTERARKLAVARLTELHAQGHDPALVLQNAVFNSYQGLFPPSQPKGNDNGQQRQTSKIDNEFNRIGRKLDAEIERERSVANIEITADIIPDAKAVRDERTGD